MKYFICALDTIQFGIMAQETEKIIQSTRTLNAVFETQTNETGHMEVFISLPALFMMQNTITPHTLVLKTRLLASKDIKIFLLTPRIENELEIPEEHIHQLPKALSDLHGYSKGVFFNNQTIQNMGLILNIDKIVEKLL